MYQRSRIKRPILTAMLDNAGVPRARVYIRNNPFPVTQHIREAVVTHGVGHEISHVAQRHNPVVYGYGYGAPVYAAPVAAPAPVVYAAPVVAPTNWGARIAKILLGPLAW